MAGWRADRGVRFIRRLLAFARAGDAPDGAASAGNGGGGLHADVCDAGRHASDAENQLHLCAHPQGEPELRRERGVCGRDVREARRRGDEGTAFRAASAGRRERPHRRVRIRDSHAEAAAFAAGGGPGAGAGKGRRAQQRRSGAQKRAGRCERGLRRAQAVSGGFARHSDAAA